MIATSMKWCKKVDLLHKSRLIIQQEETIEIESSQNQYKNPGCGL